MSPDPAPASSPASESPLSPQLAAGLRGLSILWVALIVDLVNSLLGGAALTAMIGQVMNHSGTYQSSPLINLTLSASHLVYCGTTVAELVALWALARVPARVAVLAYLGIGLRAMALVISLLYTNTMDGWLRSLLSSEQVANLYIYISYADSILAVVGTVVVVEVLLRVRRFAAPTDLAIAANQGLGRISLVGAALARTAIGYGSYAVGTDSHDQWTAYAVRMLCGLVLYGLLLRLVYKTIPALRSAKPDAAALAGGIVKQRIKEAGYHNMLFGGLWAFCGIMLTLITYQSASHSGGRYIFAYGAIIAGIVQFVRGLTQLDGRQS